MPNPFVKTSPAPFSTQYVDCVAVAKALAETWGGTLGEGEACAHGIGRVILGDLTVYIRAAKDLGRVEVGASAPALERSVSHYSRPTFPRVSSDTAKGIAKLAADLKRRVVDPAQAPLAELKGKVTAQTDARTELEAHATALRLSMPFLDIKVPADAQALEASVYCSKDSLYLSGRLLSDGRLTIDRLSAIDTDRAAAVLRALYCA